MKKTIGYIALESFLISIGIFIGFAVERYRDSSNDLDQKHRLYQELANDLKATKEHMIWLRDGMYKPLKNNLTYLIHSIENNHIKMDSFFLAVARLEFFPNVIENRATFNAIINSGRIVLFEQDSTFNKVQALYSTFDYMKINVSSHQIHNYKEYLTPFLNKYADRNAVEFDSIGNRVLKRKPRVDMTKFTSPEFLNILNLLKVSLWDETRYEMVLNEITDVIAEVEKVNK